MHTERSLSHRGLSSEFGRKEMKKAMPRTRKLENPRRELEQTLGGVEARREKGCREEAGLKL
jgi:hypothetical protein